MRTIRTRLFLSLLICALLPFAPLGCEKKKKDPMEEMTDKMERAAKDVGKALEKGAKDVKDAVEDAKKDIDKQKDK